MRDRAAWGVKLFWALQDVSLMLPSLCMDITDSDQSRSCVSSSRLVNPRTPVAYFRLAFHVSARPAWAGGGPETRSVYVKVKGPGWIDTQCAGADNQRTT